MEAKLEFGLVKRWCIQITNENKDILYNYWKNLPDVDADYGFHDWLLSDKYEDNSYLHYCRKTPNEYTEITFEQFEKYVLNKKITKKLIKIW